MLSFKLKLWLLTLLVVLTQGCGTETSSEYVSDYRIYIDSEDQEIVETMLMLADAFNQQYGSNILKFVDSKETANSFIFPTENLLQSKGQLGYGEWYTNLMAETTSSELSEKKKIYVYSMIIQFDLENVKVRSESRFDRDSTDWAHLYHLFCHEIGHGLKLSHESEKNSVMFPSIGDKSRADVDFKGFFEKVRHGN